MKFDKRFEKANQDWDRDFARLQKWTITSAIISLVVSLGMLGFFIWVIIMLLRFFGVI